MPIVKPWDGKTKIGNGSKVNVKFVINDVPYGGKVWKKPGILGVQVVDLVPYEGGDYEEFPEIDSKMATKTGVGRVI
jgi:hypothetical protein